MAIPIYPNTHHPCGRPPVQTKTPFPFANCYHWYENKATVRLRRMEDQYDDCNAVQITSMQHVKIVRHFENDLQRARAFHSEEASPLAGTGGVHSSSPSTTTPALNLETSFDGLLGMDIFGLAHDKTAEFLPLVDLWFELDEHLTANTIPTPLDFYEEVETIVEIIRDARARLPLTPTPRCDEDSDESDSISEDSAEADDSTSEDSLSDVASVLNVTEVDIRGHVPDDDDVPPEDSPPPSAALPLTGPTSTTPSSPKTSPITASCALM